MGISGKCLFCTIPEQNSTIRFEPQKNEDSFPLKEFEELIPEEILTKMNNEKKFYKNYKNSVENKTIKILDNDNDNGKELYYHGEFNEEGEKNGIGKMIIINEDNEKIFYQGIWENDILNEGNIYYMNGAEYKGQMNNYLREGQGKYISDLETYDGDWKADQKDGKGVITYKDGTKYNGDFKNNEFNGNGKMKWPDGTFYKGAFLNNTFHGKGFLQGGNYHIYDGFFEKGFYHGEGIFKWIDGDNNNIIYEGNYTRGRKDGKGKLYLKNGDIFEGNWESGLPHGEGIYETKYRKYHGNWRNGLFMQLIEVENKKENEEESFSLRFNTPNEDIYIKDHIVLFLNSNILIKSKVYNVSVVEIK